MMIKILNKLYPGKENYKKRNAVYSKIRYITGVMKFIGKGLVIIGLSVPTIVGISITII